MNDTYTRKDMARWAIEDAAERLAFVKDDWETGIYMTGLRQKHDAERLVHMALQYLRDLDQPNQPTLDELCSAAREHVANRLQPAPTDVPF